MKKLKLIVLFTLSFFTCFGQEKRDSVYFQSTYYSGIYSEVKEQPIYIRYRVLNCGSEGFSRKGISFFKNDSIHTSDNADYYKNEWDKGHLAPAATFSDSEENLNKTFSFINCAMQIDNLNRGEWAQLEQQVRDWSVNGNIKVKIDLVFAANHEIRSTGVHVPTGFWKNLTFSNGNQTCYYFPNSSTDKNWDKYETTCN